MTKEAHVVQCVCFLEGGLSHGCCKPGPRLMLLWGIKLWQRVLWIYCCLQGHASEQLLYVARSPEQDVRQDSK